jgi:hypothetical protein
MDRVANQYELSAGAREAATVEAAVSAISWGAIFAGGVVAAAVSLVLFALASGLGLASVSPWPGGGASLKAFSMVTAVALVVVQWIASGVGGYITGRLRTKWVGTHTHEVFFRDTAHGFITWGLSTVFVTAIVATGVMSAASSLLNAGAHEIGASQSGAGTVSAYNVDNLFRSVEPAGNTAARTAEARAEATRILTKSLTAGDVPAADRTYLGQLVAANTGISAADAQKRVDDVIATVKSDEVRAREAADAARKASAVASICTALSMVIGAFIACVAAALGGQLRDQHP